MKGSIYKELYVPATESKHSNGKKSRRIPLRMLPQRVKKTVIITRKGQFFEDNRKGDVILRKRVAA